MGLPVDRGSPYARPRHHGCWYYLRYFFLFVSLIQFLIILGLVLFMVYGNVHLGTEKALEATERRAQSLQGQVLGLSASCANLSKELNITARSRDSIMQMTINTRRDLDRINISYRQCQTDLAMYQNNQHILAAIILSEKQCKEQLKEDNRTCNALLQKLNQKVQALEKDMEKGKAQCALDKESLAQSVRVAEAQAAECGRAQALLQRERTLADDRLRTVQDLCAPLDRDSLETQFRELWKDSMLSYRPLTSLDLGYLRACEHLSDRLVNKAEELASRLRAGIERVARENSELQRQKLQVEEALQASKEALAKAEKEAPARENRARSECAIQTQLQLRDKEALRQERDALARELDARRQEVEQLRSKLDISDRSLETCIRAKSQIIPQKTVVVPPQPPSIKDINPAVVEEFKKKILESQGLQRSNAAPASSG